MYPTMFTVCDISQLLPGFLISKIENVIDMREESHLSHVMIRVYISLISVFRDPGYTRETLLLCAVEFNQRRRSENFERGELKD